jgi:outer membrane protein assembly factor BamB
MSESTVSTGRLPIRLWPGVLAVALQWLGWMAPFGDALPDVAHYLMLGGLFGGVLLLAVWWLFLSRAPWLERLAVLALWPLALVVTKPLLHVSVATGNMGLMLNIYSIPVLSTALVAWAALSRRVSWPRTLRLASLAATLLVACLGFALIRTEGVRSDGADLHWRWTPSYEEQFLAKAASDPAAPPATVPTAPPSAIAPASESGAAAEQPAEPRATSAPAAAAASAASAPPAAPVESHVAASPAAAPGSPAEWPGFRGPERDGVVRGAVAIETDWTKAPPVPLWRKPIGPGWSSFAVAGDRLYTQEQRGEEEDVSCYDLGSGELVWRHRDAVRFWESNAGAGPRATPTLAGGRVYTLGATGIVNALDAGSGARAWSRDAAADTGAKTPIWGFAGSPLVAGELVVVAASGRLAAYDIATGEPRWTQARGGSYSSPHLATLAGVRQVVLLSSSGASGVALEDGALLWEYAWDGVPMLQPAQTPDGDLLVTTGGMAGGEGTRRIAVTRRESGFKVEERWASRGLKGYFNDFVVHEGHAYGFDNNILAAIDLSNGQRKWKGGRYGQGQLVLLPEQDLLLVLSEDGELALVKAVPDQFTELARVPALEGKTWNHPVLVGDRLLVRNGQEMAAFRLARAGR